MIQVDRKWLQTCIKNRTTVVMWLFLWCFYINKAQSAFSKAHFKMPQTAYSFIMHEHVWIFSKSVDASKNRANVLNKTSCEEQNKKTRKAVTRKKMSLRPRCKRSMLSSAFNASFQTYRASKTFRTVLSLKLSHVKLPKAAFVVHVADLPEYGSLRPALVMDAANRPHTTYETKMQQSVWECGRKRMHIWSNKSK